MVVLIEHRNQISKLKLTSNYILRSLEEMLKR